eukprot:14938507-Alexandrium_andersonii.AAC.1
MACPARGFARRGPQLVLRPQEHLPNLTAIAASAICFRRPGRPCRRSRTWPRAPATPKFPPGGDEGREVPEE